MSGTRTPQHLHAAQFGDDDGRVGGKEGEGRGEYAQSASVVSYGWLFSLPKGLDVTRVLDPSTQSEAKCLGLLQST